jgi:hypothetical protein
LAQLLWLVQLLWLAQLLWLVQLLWLAQLLWLVQLLYHSPCKNNAIMRYLYKKNTFLEQYYVGTQILKPPLGILLSMKRT